MPELQAIGAFCYGAHCLLGKLLPPRLVKTCEVSRWIAFMEVSMLEECRARLDRNVMSPKSLECPSFEERYYVL